MFSSSLAVTALILLAWVKIPPGHWGLLCRHSIPLVLVTLPV